MIVLFLKIHFILVKIYFISYFHISRNSRILIYIVYDYFSFFVVNVVFQNSEIEKLVDQIYEFFHLDRSNIGPIRAFSG